MPALSAFETRPQCDDLSGSLEQRVLTDPGLHPRDLVIFLCGHSLCLRAEDTRRTCFHSRGTTV
jgi:hypothetical protein